jgi:tight adherence protein C
MSPLVLLLLAVGAAVGGFIATRSLITAEPSSADIVENRLRAYAAGAPVQPLTLEEIELQEPFFDRVIRPIFARAGKLLARIQPEQARQELQRKLNFAGRPYGLDATEFTAVRYALACVAGVLGLLLGLLVHSLFYAGVFVVVGALAGAFFPVLWLRQTVDRRREQIERTLPNALDLLSVAVEAGLPFEGAMLRVSQKLEGPLSQEFAQVLQEIRLGRPRLQALDDMAKRAGVEELNHFIQAIIQSSQLGTPISQILAMQSEEIRRRRRQRAQELGARAPLKMLFPMVACIFPTLWVILLGPAVLLILSQCATSH